MGYTMDVCIDIQAAVSQRAGVGRYTKLLAEHLPAAAGADRLTLFSFDFRRAGSPLHTPGARHRTVRWCPGRAAQWAWKTLHWPPFDWLAGAADLYHFPNFILPPLSRGRAVVTIHDVSFLRYPEFAEEQNLRYLNRMMADTVRRADAVLTDSEFCAGEIRAAYRLPAGRVRPVHLGVGAEFIRPAESAMVALRRDLRLDRPYLLHVGTIEPRKHLPFLIEVFERMLEYDGLLVLAGGPGWKCEPVFARIAASPRADRIRYVRYVTDAQLPALYAAADAFVFPSFYEGFGLPPLEAMACGTPVVSSAGGSLPEVLGDGAVSIPEYASERWATEVLRLLGDGAWRARQIAAGRARAARYTWAETARRTWTAYREIAT